MAEGFGFQTLQTLQPTLQPDTKLIDGDGALGEQASCLLWSSQFQAMQHWESSIEPKSTASVIIGTQTDEDGLSDSVPNKLR